METTKTILEWLNEIEEPEIREAAIENYENFGRPYEKVDLFKRLSDALLWAFDWDKNCKLAGTWNNYHNKLISQGK